MCQTAIFCVKYRSFQDKLASWGKGMLYVFSFLYLGAIKMSICLLNFKYRRMGNVHYQIHFSSFLLSTRLQRAQGLKHLVKLQHSPKHMHARGLAF